jgi:hypothetical protein
MLKESDKIGSMVSAKITKLSTDKEILIVQRDKTEKKIAHIDRLLRALNRILDTKI